MGLDLEHQAAGRELARELARLHAYLAELLERASRRAERLHADELALEHLIGAALEDEDSAASQVTSFAFADPETLADELLALSPGVMVVGSAATLPFSPLAMRALFAARAEAAADAAPEIDCARITRHALGALDPDARAALEGAGFHAPDARPAAATERSGAAADGPLFRHFDEAAKRALSRASHGANLARETSIAPARLVLGCLEAAPDLAERTGLGAQRAKSVLRGKTRDDTPPDPRELVPDPALVAFLAGLPDGAGSLELLLACHGPGGTDELRQLLLRHKVTRELLERSTEAFEDPTGT